MMKKEISHIFAFSQIKTVETGLENKMVPYMHLKLNNLKYRKILNVKCLKPH